MKIRRSPRYWITLTLLGTLILLLVPVDFSAAGTIYVDDDTCPGVGSGTSGDPFCSIQDAIDAAVNGDIVNIAAGTYVENLGIPTPLQVTLQGAGKSTTIVDGGAGGSVLIIGTGDDISLSGLTIQNGLATTGGGISNSGSLSLENCDIKDNLATVIGGGIYHASSVTLTITNCVISGNQASAPGAYGGGLAVYGSAELIDSLVTANESHGGGGGIDAIAGASLTLTNSTVSNNTVSGDSGSGGGIKSGGTLVLTGTTVEGNHVTGLSGLGGGIYINGVTAVITDSSIISNDATQNGGGIYLGFGTLALTNSIVRGNTVSSPTSHGGGLFLTTETLLQKVEVSGNSAGYLGGGIKAQPESGEAVGLLNVTVSGNTAEIGGGIYSTGLGETNLVHATIYNNHISSGSETGGLRAFNTVNIVNSLIAGNDNDQCGSTTINSVGYNLAGDGTCSFTGTGDLINTDPMLGPLADNGGFSKTHKPTLTSLAINAGRPTDVFPEDQRGYPRPVGVLPDIGAVEVQMPYGIFLPLIMR